MRTMKWMMLFLCVGCGDAMQNEPLSDERIQASSLVMGPSHHFDIKSAAFDMTETGLTRSITLVVSDQSDVCQDVLDGRRHRHEHRLTMVGMAGGETPLTTQFTMAQARTQPRMGTSMLMVPAFYELNEQCSNVAPRVLGGAMTVFHVNKKVAGAAYNLQVSGGASDDVMGSVSAKYCRGLNDVRKTTTYRTCLD